MAQLTIAPSAQEDLVAIMGYIAQDNPPAAERWINRVQTKCQLLAQQPHLGERRPEFGSDIRMTFVGRYIIFYRPIPDGIEVVRVIAGDRDIHSL